MCFRKQKEDKTSHSPSPFCYLPEWFTNNPKMSCLITFSGGAVHFNVLQRTALTGFLSYSLSFTVCLCDTGSCSLLCYRCQTALLYNQNSFVFCPMESWQVEKDLKNLQVQPLTACPLNLIMKCHICLFFWQETQGGD